MSGSGREQLEGLDEVDCESDEDHPCRERKGTHSYTGWGQKRKGSHRRRALGYARRLRAIWHEDKSTSVLNGHVFHFNVCVLMGGRAAPAAQLLTLSCADANGGVRIDPPFVED